MKQNGEVPALVSLARGAELIECSTASLKHWGDCGLVPMLRVEGRRLSERVFPKADLLRFAAERAQGKRSGRR